MDREPNMLALWYCAICIAFGGFMVVCHVADFMIPTNAGVTFLVMGLLFIGVGAWLFTEI